MGKKEWLYRWTIGIVGVAICWYCIWLSGFPVGLKILLFLSVTISCFSGSGKVASKMYAGAVMVIMAIGLYYNIVPYGQYRWNTSASFNKYTHGIATQTSYVRGTGDSDVILPILFRDKIVLIDDMSTYKQYVELFSEGIITDKLENAPKVLLQIESMKDSFIYVGRMSICSMDFLFSQEDYDKMRKLVVQVENPVLYVEKAENVTEDTLVILSDSKYNLYILSYSLYESLL